MGGPAESGTPVPRTRALFLNENIGGHTTMHRAISEALTELPEVRAEFVTVPPPGIARRLVAAPVPGLESFDLDFNPIRYQLAQGLVARRLIKGRLEHFDVLHAYSQNALFACDDLQRRLPSVVSTDCTAAQNAYRLPYRAPTRFTHLHARLSHRFEQRVFDAATMVVAQSEWAAASLAAICGVDDDRLRVIPFGMMPVEPRSRRRPSGLPQVTFVGRTLDRKGGVRLLRTWRERLRERCDLNLVTRDVVDREPGLRVFDDFTPGDDRLRELLAETTVFALPSEMDMSPYSILEAMFAGCPVVASDVGGIPEMVLDGETGVLLGDSTDRALAGALGGLLDDEVTAEGMGRAGRAHALARFDARVTTRALVDVLAEARRRFVH
jgi:starch synthase